MALPYCTQRVSSVARGLLLAGLISSLLDHYYRAGDLVGVRHNSVEDGVDRAPDVVLRDLVGAVGVINHLRVSLLCLAQGAISAKSQGAGFIKVVPWDLTCECAHSTLFDEACVAISC